MRKMVRHLLLAGFIFEQRNAQKTFMATLRGSCRCFWLLFEAKSVGARHAAGLLGKRVAKLNAQLAIHLWQP